jgi:hypothetical protein
MKGRYKPGSSLIVTGVQIRRGLNTSEAVELSRDPDVDVAIAREEQGMRQSLRALKRAGTVRRNTLFGNNRNSDDNVKPSHKL